MARGVRWWFRSLILLVVLSAAAFVFRDQWLPYLGTLLESAGSPSKADIAVVLSGDLFGNRILKGAELARLGFVPRVLVSGPSGIYGYHDSDLAIAFAVKKGYPQSMFVPAPNDARSTRDEAAALVPELRKLGVKRVLLVTSDYHTRRAGQIFRKAAPDLEIETVAAPDTDFRLDRWWQTREGRKYVLIEWLKTVAERLGF